ncbi:hypothetical protein MJO29_001668 [Puccinia striiformis f. sp. tritici]|uniref:hypothetical protein n=2 Tax=Puccinia striiformis f. sp. tritici TaxID=168172 RepID=UPI0020072BAA|nr:hypothetical protein Pst134EA_003133 [Puccinia striiformis f. sp. tritici]KAH9472523.1 hypothetical protein Pst134EA_003133 [Puccinia striiformis f. sp. tritici]KAI7965920.1 hypothetical protein MJO29_001668 [Puccinia striiformis f. sp. tritici]KAI9631569.1 hypothetical protein KEM48_014219 [Puccinia striiformis f. sp. tritici PST-130]
MNVIAQLRSIAPSRHALGRSKARCLQVRSLTNTGTARNIGNDRSPADQQGVENYDVVIVGGGVVGLTLANAFASCRTLQQAGYRVAVLEASDLTKLRDWSLPSGQWSNRVSSITNENLDFLKQIGAWQYIDQSRTNPVERMQVWDGLSDARIVFDSLDGVPPSAEPTGEIPQMARFVENVHLQKALLQNLDKRALVDLYGSTKVASISPDEANWPLIKTEDGQCLKARLLVGADGFNSPVKSYSQISSTGWNYNAHCVVGTLELEPTMYNWTAWQRFLTAGPLGFLPLSDRHASLAWSTLPHIATGLKALDSQTLASAINACFRLPHESVAYLLERIGAHSAATPLNSAEIQAEIDWRSSPSVHAGDTVSSGEAPPKVLQARMETIASFPLRMFHADQYLGTSAGSDHSSSLENTSQPTRTVLVGDAAHVLHPMAGQGLNLGLGDARELAKTVRIAIENGQDIGGLTALAPYARSRYLANHLVMATVDKLNKLYSLETPPIVWVRSVGVEVLNELPGLKAAMMGSAGGTPGTASSNGPWPAIATAYETAQKARVIVEGLGSIAAGAIVSTIHRATAPKI